MKKTFIFLMGLISSILSSQIQNKFDEYQRMASSYEQIDLDSAIYFNNLSKKWAKSENEKTINEIFDAKVFAYQRKFDAAEKKLKTLENISINRNDYLNLSRIYNVLTNVSGFKEDYKNAEFYSKKEYENAKKTKDNNAIVRSVVNYGGILIQNKKFKEGIAIYNEAEKYVKETDKYPKAFIYFNLSTALTEVGKYKESLNYQLKCEKLIKEIQMNDRLASLYQNMAQNYLNLKDIQKAKNYCDKAIKLAKTDEDISNANYTMSQILLENNDKSSIRFIKKAVNIDERNNFSDKLGMDYLLMGRSYFLEGKRDSADYFFNKSEKILSKGNDFNNKQVLFLYKIKNTLLKDNDTQSVADLDSLVNIFTKKSSIFQSKSVLELDTKYKTAEKESQIKSQQLQLEKEKSNRNLAFGGIGILAALSLGGFFFLRNHQQKQELQNKNALLSLQQNLNIMELNNLNKQLDPHEIKNLLATISPEIQTKAPEAYKKMIKLMNLTKASLNSSSLTENLESQLAQIDDYLSLESQILKNTLHYKITNQLENKNIQIPRFLLKNLVENSIRHGIRKIEKPGEIEVKVFENKGMYHIVVDDNGIGRKDKISQDSGIGTSTYQNLFNLLNHKNAQKASFTILDKVEGTQVEVKIPVNYRYS